MPALFILQWNAQGMHGHGDELIKYINSKRDEIIHLICIQETWYQGSQTIYIPNYTCFSKSRNSRRGGGCAFYIHNSLDYEYKSLNVNCEMQSINIHLDKTIITIINYYNDYDKE